MQFGSLLKHYRQKRRISLREFSRLVKLGHSYLSEIENNHKPAPNDVSLMKMTKALGLNDEEKIHFFDTASLSKNLTDTSNFHMPADISDYILHNGVAKDRLRKEIYSNNKQ